MSHGFTVTQTEPEFNDFRMTVVTHFREIADSIERGETKYVAIALATCTYESEGGPLVIIDSEAATVELVDEMVDMLKNAMFEALDD